MDDQIKARKRYSATLILIGFLILIYPLSTEALGSYTQYRLKSNWERESIAQQEMSLKLESRQRVSLDNETFSNENAVLTQVAPSGARSVNREFPSTKIIIPKVGIDQVIIKGVGVEELKNGPGHYSGTALPGKKGNVGIAGHRVTYTKPFNRIDELVAGDEIILETLSHTYTYKVEFSKVLDPSDVSMLRPSNKAELTLTTCTPKYSARQRLDVRAILVKSVPRQKDSIIKRLIAKVAPTKTREEPLNIYELAIDEAKKRLKTDPNDIDAHIQLGAAYQAEKRLDDAMAEYMLAAKIDPNHSLPQYRMGVLFEQLENFDLAKNSYAAAASMEPSNDDAIFRLGDLFIRLKEYESAVFILKQGVERSPLSADLHYYLALAFEKSGADRKAIEHFEEAIRFVPDFDEAKAGLKRILK